jgi:hypothetical protein
VKAWRLLAILGAVNMFVGGAVLAVGFAYDLIGKAPGQIALVGVGMISWPFLILSAAAKNYAKILEAEQRRSSAVAEREELRLSRSRVYLDDRRGDRLEIEQ